MDFTDLLALADFPADEDFVAVEGFLSVAVLFLLLVFVAMQISS
ncbi:MAG: hypothetical protein ACLGSH_19615 [Acidobacteriota bacterium]